MWVLFSLLFKIFLQVKGTLFFLLSIITLQCCVSFCCTMMWISYSIHIIPLPSWTSLPAFRILYPPRSPQSTKLSSLCFLAVSHQLFVLHMVECMCQSTSQFVQPSPFPRAKSEREKQTLYINAHKWTLEKWYRWSYSQGSNRDSDIGSCSLPSRGGVLLSFLSLQ